MNFSSHIFCPEFSPSHSNLWDSPVHGGVIIPKSPPLFSSPRRAFYILGDRCPSYIALLIFAPNWHPSDWSHCPHIAFKLPDQRISALEPCSLLDLLRDLEKPESGSRRRWHGSLYSPTSEELKQQKFTVSLFWRTEVQEQDVSRAMLPLKTLGFPLSFW